MKRTFLITLFISMITVAYSQNDSIKLGAKYKGGVIFQLDESGKHGLISAPFDQNKEKVMWGKNALTRANSMTDGKSNTELIIRHIKINSLTDKFFAACLCDTLTLGGFTDWYLPAIDELKEMYLNRDIIGNFKQDDYTSSTEAAGDESWSMHFDAKKPLYHYNKHDRNYYIRCVRRF